MKPLNRRTFVKASLILGSGVGATGLLLSCASAAATTSEEGLNIIGPRDGFSPQIGTLVSMLNWMRNAVLESVQGLSVSQLDYLHDAKANSIGALLLHLAAVERLYQVHAFEGRKWNDWDEVTKKRWGVPAGLGEPARQTIRGHDLSYYVDVLREGREHTLSELRKRDDDWLMQIDREWVWGPTNNYCKWFHVCEHESHHNGQIRWIKARVALGPMIMSQESIYTTLYAALALTDSIFQMWTTLTFAVIVATYVAGERFDRSVYLLVSSLYSFASLVLLIRFGSAAFQAFYYKALLVSRGFQPWPVPNYLSLCIGIGSLVLIFAGTLGTLWLVRSTWKTVKAAKKA